MEGDSFEIITAFDTITHMGEAIKAPISSELRAALVKIAEANGAAPAPMFTPAPAPAAPVPGVPVSNAPSSQSPDKILESMQPSVFKTVNVSVDAAFWEWGEGETIRQPRYCGKPTSWVNKEKSVIRIAWEEGRDLDGNVVLDASGKPKVNATAQAAVKELLKHGFRLECFDDGSPPPSISVVAATPAPEPQPAQEPTPAQGTPVSDVHLLAAPDFTDIKYLEALARAVVSPAAKYFVDTMEGKRGGQLERMKTVRFFNPLHVLASGSVTEAHIEGLSIWRLSKHPKIAPMIEVRACTAPSSHAHLPFHAPA